MASPYLSLSQQRALAIVPKFTGLLSLAGSTFIVQDIVRDPKKRKRTYSKLLLGVSSIDAICSFTYFLSTWPIPANHNEVLYASGNRASCSFQGFFLQLAIAAPMFNLGLVVYYLLILKYKWPDRRVKIIEKYTYGLALFVGFSTSIAGLPLKLYNNALLWCWIACLPSPDDSGVCIRGQKAQR